jgi:hypothetical protein
MSDYISPPARAALERRLVVLQKIERRMAVYEAKYQPLLAALSNTEFRVLMILTSQEAWKRWPLQEGESVQEYVRREQWIEDLVKENGG